jgi:hypothetical protein
VTEALREAAADGRLTAFDRTHDITEHARAVAQVAGWAREVRRARHEHRGSLRGGRKALSLAYLNSMHGAPRWQIERLARAAVRRLLPALQNIISRLPAAERQAVATDEEGYLRSHIQTLAQLSTLARKAGDEYERIDEGFGAVEMAALEAHGMLRRAADLARRCTDDGDPPGWGAALLRRGADEATAVAGEALDKLATDRFDVLAEDSWRRRKGAMVRYAHAAGGIAPPLELLYHSRGSAFRAY